MADERQRRAFLLGTLMHDNFPKNTFSLWTCSDCGKSFQYEKDKIPNFCSYCQSMKLYENKKP